MLTISAPETFARNPDVAQIIAGMFAQFSLGRIPSVR